MIANLQNLTHTTLKNGRVELLLVPWIHPATDAQAFRKALNIRKKAAFLGFSRGMWQYGL
jgi:hypothetical protein